MRKPSVRIIGESGVDLFKEWSSAGLTEVSFTDVDGGEADEVAFIFAVAPPFPAPSAPGQKYRFAYGWEGLALRDAGLFTAQSSSISGDAESGYQLQVTARASDFVDTDKADASEHFDEMTVGEIFNQLARKSGKTAVVDPDIAKQKIPYRLRHNQSTSGFAAELAEEFGGTLKYADGKMLVPKRNGGKTASGTAMPVLLIEFSRCIGLELSQDEKDRFEKVAASYVDPADGIPELLEATAAGKVSKRINLHPSRSKAEAQTYAAASGAELSRISVSGSIDVEGDTDAMAGATVRLSGFGAYDAAQLVASAISHTITFDATGGWLMSVEVSDKAQL